MTDNERKELLLKAKPILFNTEMVRAILYGKKSVTRRAMKNVPDIRGLQPYMIPIRKEPKGLIARDGRVYHFKSPYNVGDMLYVRETFYKDSHRYMYKADYSEKEKFYIAGKEIIMKWKPSIHMPKEAARIFLRVTNVRVEWLQDITDDDCMAEGICSWTKDGKLYKYYLADEEGDYPACKWSECPKTPQAAMQCVWNSTIKKSDLAKYGWDANPWVWVIEFERIGYE